MRTAYIASRAQRSPVGREGAHENAARSRCGWTAPMPARFANGRSPMSRPQPLARRSARARRTRPAVRRAPVGDQDATRRPGTRHRPRSSVSCPTTAPEVRPRTSIPRRQRLHRRRAPVRGRTPFLFSCAPSVSPRSQRGAAASAWAWLRSACRAQLTPSRPLRTKRDEPQPLVDAAGGRQRTLCSGSRSLTGSPATGAERTSAPPATSGIPPTRLRGRWVRPPDRTGCHTFWVNPRRAGCT